MLFPISTVIEITINSTTELNVTLADFYKDMDLEPIALPRPRAGYEALACAVEALPRRSIGAKRKPRRTTRGQTWG